VSLKLVKRAEEEMERLDGMSRGSCGRMMMYYLEPWSEREWTGI
jgi:hypothetical protein